jgi:hypothetical protein
MFANFVTTTLLLALAQAGSGAAAPAGQVLDLALSGYHLALEDSLLEPGGLLAVIDYSLPSTEPRLFVIDPGDSSVVRSSLVAHGRNSGQNMAERFSNESGSKMSSLGFFVTEETYQGQHGYTLRLRGLEKGINDRAKDRLIVIHGASYVSEDFIAQHGRLGRSWGCPALPLDSSKAIIDLIKNGTCLFVYGTDPTYLENSHFLGPERHTAPPPSPSQKGKS